MIRSTVLAVAAAIALTAPFTTADAQVIPAKGGATPAPTLATDTPPSANPPSTELLHSSTVRLLQSDYDTQLQRLPPDARLGFGTDIDRINALLRTILADKTLAEEARKTGVASDPEVAARIAAETDRMLALAVMERNDAAWGKEFDARPNMTEAARERWLAQPERYKRPEEVKLTHILYATSKHENAQALAQAARAKIVAGADMSALARAESDEPTAKEDGGQTDWSPGNKFDARVARAIAALKKVGDVSNPVRTPNGYYVVRLDGKRGGETRPFDQVKDEIIRDMRKNYIDEQRAKRMAAIRNDPSIVVNQPAVDRLLVRIDPEVIKQSQSPQAPPPGAAK